MKRPWLIATVATIHVVYALALTGLAVFVLLPSNFWAPRVATFARCASGFGPNEP